MPNAKSSSDDGVPKRGRRTKPAVPLQDQDALDALAFARRGRPDAEIGYSNDAPRSTPEQLAEFEPASFRFTKDR